MSQSTKEIVIVDYKKGNLASVQHGFTQANMASVITSDPEKIAAAPGIVLPGVGAFADAMGYMNQSGQTQAIKEALLRGVPFLGICLGLQLLFEKGDERAMDANAQSATEEKAACEETVWTEGLGVLPGYCSKIQAQGHKVPHVGWNKLRLEPAAAQNPLLENVPDGTFMYFTHSYVAYPADASHVVATTEHGCIFPSMVTKGNVFGVQFHPEKSSAFGMRLLENFGNLVFSQKGA